MILGKINVSLMFKTKLKLKTSLYDDRSTQLKSSSFTLIDNIRKYFVKLNKLFIKIQKYVVTLQKVNE